MLSQIQKISLKGIQSKFSFFLLEMEFLKKSSSFQAHSWLWTNLDIYKKIVCDDVYDEGERISIYDDLI